MHRLFSFSTLGMTVALASCRAPVAPTAAGPAFDRATAIGATAAGANGFAVTTLRLRPGSGSESTMWGVFHATFGVFFPPSPCASSFLPAIQGVAVCAFIHNPAGERLEGGTLVLHPPEPGEPISLRIAGVYPPSPCRTYLVRGFVNIPPDLALPSGTPITAAFSSSLGAIETIPPGPPQLGDFGQPVVGSAVPSPDAGSIEGDPLPAPACMVSVGPVGE